MVAFHSSAIEACERATRSLTVMKLMLQMKMMMTMVMMIIIKMMMIMMRLSAPPMTSIA